MANLNEYLGTLVSNFSQARVLADLESAKIAELYATDGILKHFSIPRMKIDDDELTIPVSIDELNIKSLSIENLPDPQSLKSSIYNVLLESMESKSLPMELSVQVRKEITLLIEPYANDKTKKSLEELQKTVPDSLASQLEKTVNKLVTSNEIDATVSRNMDLLKRAATEKIKAIIKEELSKKDIKEEIRNLNVTMETGRLKDKVKENLVFIKMKISEESMEWEIMEDADGNIVKKLMPA